MNQWHPRKGILPLSLAESELAPTKQATPDAVRQRQIAQISRRQRPRHRRAIRLPEMDSRWRDPGSERSAADRSVRCLSDSRRGEAGRTVGAEMRRGWT